MAGRLVVDRRARRWLMIRWSSKSKPPRNEPLILKRAASRGTVSKTIGDQISVDSPPGSLPPAKAFYILEWRRPRGIFYLFFRARALTDMEMSVQRMSTRKRGRVSEKEQAQCDGGRTGADPEADPPVPPGSGSLQFNKIQ
ncbi:hypothetical protein T12_14114 [Trichinella patagoniensis]|uniref:Uncharacterized protein n=1 Tax=Trichinella patagoniensis TaxID=990121 RepID=A0A0V0Z5Y2_9BILA|nr:hypothetical protein T12_14114 [Trichinella patagoniensis]